MKKVLIVTGSQSDHILLHELSSMLRDAKIEYDVKTASCHRDLKGLYNLLGELESADFGVIIAIANAVSNMPAIVASYLKETNIVVIGVGLDNKSLHGLDSLLSVNTIPKGVPLATTGIGDVGLYNAGLLAIKLARL